MLARQIAVGFGIAVIFPLLIYYGVATFYPPPKLSATVVATMMPPNPTSQERQKSSDQQQAQKKREEAYKTAARDFARHLLMISTLLGVAAVLIGAYVAPHAIGTGLIFGGIFAVMCGYWNYWSFLDDWVRFVSLLVGFLVLLFVGYRQLGNLATGTVSS